MEMYFSHFLMKTGQLFNKAHNEKTNNRLRFKFLFCLAENKVKVQTIQTTANKTILANLLNTTLTPLVLLSLQISLISWPMN